MREVNGDLFTHGGPIVIPTNCEVKKNGEAVMGAGLALSIASAWPKFPAEYGAAITRFGHPDVWRWDMGDGYVWFTFPTKYHWRDSSDLDLICSMAEKLVLIVDKIMDLNLYDWKYYQNIGLPRVGCGLGNLNWEKQVRPELADLLDDRFVVYS